MTTFDKAFHVAYVLFHVSFGTAVAFADYVSLDESMTDGSMLDLADWFESWCSEQAVENEMAYS